MDEVLWLLLLSVITVARGGTKEKVGETGSDTCRIFESPVPV